MNVHVPASEAVSHETQVEFEYYDQLHSEKYRDEKQTKQEHAARIATNLSSSDVHKSQLYISLFNNRFLPAGRVQAAMGASEREVSPFNCLSGDTLYVTDRGIQSLKESVNSYVNVLSPESGEFEKAYVKSYGRQSLYEISIFYGRFGQSRNGSFKVKATKNHRWLLQDGSITDTVKIGDVLSCSNSSVEMNNSGFVHGLIYGDGSRERDRDSNELCDKYRIRLCGAKNEHLNYFKDMDNIISVTSPPSYNGDILIRVHSPRTNMKELPTTGSSPEYVSGFVHGLIAADGSVGASSRPNILYGTHDTVKWLENNLIYAGYAPCGKPKDKTHYVSNYVEERKEHWSINYRVSEEHSGYRIRDIKYVGEEEVFCVEEPKYKLFTLSKGLATGNCSVSQVIHDDMASIMGALSNAALILRLGTGIGYNFSNLRPKGAEIKKLKTEASGPLSFMQIYNVMAGTIASSGHRRGAQMAILNVNHPDIEAFIDAKMAKDTYRQFNFSVGVSDAFMDAVCRDADFDLSHGGRIYKTISARKLWEKITHNAYISAEPGIIFIDRLNDQNNLHYCEKIEATNPCAEQPLPPYGLCMLGSFNLPAYIQHHGDGTPFLNYGQLVDDIHSWVEAYDNIFDNAIYAIPEHKEEAISKRRIGLGYTGIASAIEYLCGKANYGEPEFIQHLEHLCAILQNEAYRASVRLAQKRGAFAKYNPAYLDGAYIKRLPEDIQRGIAEHGIRNSHLVSYAPCGTISQCADNVSSGVEPVFHFKMSRSVFMRNGQTRVTIKDYNYRTYNFEGKTLEHCSVADHMAVSEVVQKFCDSAVSKTVNVASDCTFEEYKKIYEQAHGLGLKGITVYRPNDLRGIVIAKAEEKQKDVPAQVSAGFASIPSGCASGACSL